MGFDDIKLYIADAKRNEEESDYYRVPEILTREADILTRDTNAKTTEENWVLSPKAPDTPPQQSSHIHTMPAMGFDDMKNHDAFAKADEERTLQYREPEILTRVANNIQIDIKYALSGPYPDTDPIHECGSPALSLLKQNPTACMQLGYQKLHDTPYAEVKTCWRRLYTDAALQQAFDLLENSGHEVPKKKKSSESDEESDEDGLDNDWADAILPLDELIPLLDKAVILTGAPQREELISSIFAYMAGELFNPDSVFQRLQSARRKKFSAIPETFPETTHPIPQLRFPLERIHKPSFEDFQNRINKSQTPFIITGTMGHWPALTTHPWSNPRYLMAQTLGGRRLVPVELGRSYTDEGWGQKLLSFQEFMEEYMLKKPDQDNDKGKNIAYLAQHDLFTQIPSLHNDILIPDYCYTSPPSTSSSPTNPTLDTPLLNAWFGPAGTTSPLHTDPYHNIFAQVVGHKYIRLYAPTSTPQLYPRGRDETTGVNMSNTSNIDLDVAMELENNEGDVSGEEKRAFMMRFPGFLEEGYCEAVLGPGECLYLPCGWWHFVRGLSASASVSFWWD